MTTQRKRLRPVAILLFIIAVIVSTFFYQNIPRESFSAQDPAAAGADNIMAKVHFINAGQGDSILIESDGHYMLIDAGENKKGSTVTQYLDSLKIQRLDYVIGTHPHSDHIGGLDTVIKAFDIGKVILPPVTHTTKTFEDLLDALRDKDLKIARPTAGDIYQLGSATFQIIAPNKDYGDNLNNWSVGIRLTCGNNAFLFAGDAEKEAEHDMTVNGLPLQADVLKLGHHGSRTSSTDEFLDKVNPSYAVILCGRDNSYGHPHKEILEKLKARNIQVFRTDRQGTITAAADGTNITWTTEE